MVAARATDTSGNVSTTNTVSVRFFNVPGGYLQRLSGGNPANVTDCSGNIWLRDQAYSRGRSATPAGLPGMSRIPSRAFALRRRCLYQRERYSTSAGGSAIGSTVR